MGDRHKSAPPEERNLLIETANENARGVLRPIGGISPEGDPGALAKAAKGVRRQLEQEYDDIDYMDEDELRFGIDDDADLGLDAVEEHHPESEAPVPKPLKTPSTKPTAPRPRSRISIRTVAAHLPTRALIPNIAQLRTALGVAAVFALVLSLAVAYHLPTSTYGLKALGVIATASMGFAVLVWPMRLRTVAQWLLAACMAATVHYSKPIDALAKMGAELRLYEADPIVRGSAGRTLAILGRKDFTGLDLQGANLSGLDLSFTSLRGANLRGADLNYSNLTRAQLTLAKIASADLGNANLVGTNLKEAVGYEKAYCNRRTKMPSGFTCQNGTPMVQAGVAPP